MSYMYMYIASAKHNYSATLNRTWVGAGDSSDVGRWRCGSAASSGKSRQSVHSHMPRQNELPLP